MDLFEKELKTKYGIDKLDLMVRLMPVIQPDNTKKLANKYNSFKSWLVEKLQRGLSKNEEAGLLEGIVAYIQSKAATNERLKSMNYLFELKFLV
ncbi:MAG: hypothetical protein IMY67_11155 [Bacteroidetes bacterium]|nr:hypothetical protein [Bacteroidota bacterium]